MNMEQLENLAEVIGVLLVIASLIYVAKQLRQTTEALHAQSRQSVLSSSQAELFALMNDSALAQSFVEGHDLSADENIRLHVFLSALVRAREFSWLQFRNGQIDETQWATELVVMQNVLGTKRTHRWWDKKGGTPSALNSPALSMAVFRINLRLTSIGRPCKNGLRSELSDVRK